MKEIEEPTGTGHRFPGRLDHTGEKEGEPFFPITIEPDILEKLVVGLPVAFKMKGKVEQWLAEDTFRTKDEGDEKTAETAIAIEKRVDRLKLDVSERGLEQRTGGDGFIMKKFFQRSHAICGEIGRSRDKSRISRTRSADPILRTLKLARLL